ncbi:hypothetical protein C5B91_21190 [Haloferax sp. Atlit-10N]|uniref:hypothetical protein n=1 Tax=Haloferax sp. Atlit-10N TaxID=2077204 RepID=UPI000E39E746|nr:hypothetical protein [Haloferax sp. Atlit-10N]RDZ51607.1 hypothetical protein C5B91_21190 [Haloferax sp. Atlit-10N]
MSNPSVSLHDKILNEFGNRIQESEDIPPELVEKLEELDRYGLESTESIESALDEVVDDAPE